MSMKCDFPVVNLNPEFKAGAANPYSPNDNSVWSSNNTTTVKKSTVTTGNETPENATNDIAKLQEEVEDILGKDEFAKLPLDMQRDVLNKYDAFQKVLKLEGDDLSDRVKGYVKALQAHQVELEMSAYNETLFKETLQVVAVNPEIPTEAELNEVLKLVQEKKKHN